MPFYLATKGTLHPHDFRYLAGDYEKARMEPTIVPGKIKELVKPIHPENKVDFFAIDIMSKMVKTLNSKSSLSDVRSLMQIENIRHVPIVENHKFMGMISDRDLLKLDMAGTFTFLKAEEVMNTLIVVATEETPLAHIARVLLEEKISAIPIVNDKFHLSGIVTISDILRTVIYNRLVLK